MRVRATRLVYYGLKRIRVGQTFTLKAAKDFRESCMEKLDEPEGSKQSKRGNRNLAPSESDVSLVDESEKTE